MTEIKLNAHQKALADEVAELVETLKQGKEGDQTDVARWYDDLARSAHDLHMSLKSAGIEPRHHRYMLQNRGVPPADPAFYRHIHPAEDLLSFVSNLDANKDAEDRTIGAEFSFRVFNRRWGHDDNYQLRRTAEGWRVERAAIIGDCDLKAWPYLYNNFDQDGIKYPADLPNYFEWLWLQASELGLSASEVQRELDRLARWVSICEQNTPAGIFKEYSGAAINSAAV